MKATGNVFICSSGPMQPDHSQKGVSVLIVLQLLILLLCFLLLSIYLSRWCVHTCCCTSFQDHCYCRGAKQVQNVQCTYKKTKKKSEWNQVLRYSHRFSKCFFGRFVFSPALSTSIWFVIMRFTLMRIANESRIQIKSM